MVLLCSDAPRTFLKTLITLIYLSLGEEVHMIVIVWCSEENRVWESALSFHLMVLGTGLVSLRLGTSIFIHRAISLVCNDIFLVGVCSFSLYQPHLHLKACFQATVSPRELLRPFAEPVFSSSTFSIKMTIKAFLDHSLKVIACIIPSLPGTSCSLSLFCG